MTETLNYASPPTPKRFGRGLFGWILFLGLALVLFVWLQRANIADNALPFSTVHREITKGNVSYIVLDADEIRGVFRSPIILGVNSVGGFRTSLPQGLCGSWEFIQFLSSNAGEFRVEPTNNIVVNLLLPLVPWLLILGFIWFFVIRQLRNTAQSRPPQRVIVVNPENK